MLTLVLGDSKLSVPQYISDHPNMKPCNVLMIDGGHDQHTASLDIANFRMIANKTHNVVIVDDTDNAEVAAAYNAAVGAGIVRRGINGADVIKSNYCDTFTMHWTKNEAYGYESPTLVPDLKSCKRKFRGEMSVGQYVFNEDEALGQGGGRQDSSMHSLKHGEEEL